MKLTYVGRVEGTASTMAPRQEQASRVPGTEKASVVEKEQGESRGT